MKVKMKQDKKGSPDGIQVIDYKEGKIYDMPDVLAEAFIDRKLAVAVKSPETKVEGPDETKVIEPPETKEKKRGEK